MAKLTLSVPVVGEKRSIAEPKVDTALKEIETWANGNIGSNNIEAKGVTEAMLATAVQTLLNEKTAGGVMKKSIIATEETRESAVYGTLTTPDEVEVVMVANGLIMVGYQATWKKSEAGATAKAALFFGANQVKAAKGAAPTEPTVAETSLAAADTKFTPLATTSALTTGLASGTGTGAYSGDVTTGQIIGAGESGGPIFLFAAAGTYKINVKFKATAGKVTAKNRNLWALAYA